MSSKRDPSVFISYRRADAAANVGRLFDWLTRQFRPDGVQFTDVFVDTQGIAPGERFARVLERKLAAADVVLVVIGPDWLDIADEHGRRLDQPDDYVRMEVEAALAANKRVIPVLVGGAEMPSAELLPESLRGLCAFNATPLRDAIYDFENDFDRLVDAILQRRRGIVETETDRLRRRLRAIKLSAWLVPAVVVIVVPVMALVLSSLFALDTRIASYLMWAGEQIAPAPPDPGVTLVTIDPETESWFRQRFGGDAVADWRRRHADLIDRAAAAGAKAVVFDLFFEQSTTADDALAAAAKRAMQDGARVVFGARAVSGGQPSMVPALRDAALWGSVCINHRIGYTYSAPVAVAGPGDHSATPRATTPALALTAVQGGGLDEIDIDRRELRFTNGAADPPVRFSRMRRIFDPGLCGTLSPGDDTAALLIRFAGPGYWRDGTRHASYADALDADATPDTLFRNRIVIVGATLPRIGDQVVVTSGFDRHRLFGVDLHANAIANLATHREMVTTTLDMRLVITTVAAILGASLGFLTGHRPVNRQRLWLAMLVAVYVVACSMAASRGLLLNPLYHVTAFAILFLVLRRLRNGGFETSTAGKTKE